MQPTDLNAHAAPWQGPRPTSSSGSQPATSTASPRTSGASPDDHRSFVLHENVTNAHAAKPDARVPAHATTRSGARHHLWWGAAQLHQHVPPHVTARGGTHWARRPVATTPMTSATPFTQSAGTPPTQQHAPVVSKETPPRTPLPERVDSKPRVAASATSTPGSLIFDGRMHRNANPTSKPVPTAAPTPRALPQVPSSDRSQSASSTASSSSAGRGPLLGSESILFDSSVIVQPSVTPAVNVSHPGTSLLSTPPVNAEDLAIILPSPMPTADDPNHHSRVVFDVADLLGGINLPSQDLA